MNYEDSTIVIFLNSSLALLLEDNDSTLVTVFEAKNLAVEG